MNNSLKHLEMRWVPVTSPNGRTHMEAVWISVADEARPATNAA